MKNREWLMKMPLIDVLDMFANNIGECPAWLLTGKTRGLNKECKYYHSGLCSKEERILCISNWLAEEKPSD